MTRAFGPVCKKQKRGSSWRKILFKKSLLNWVRAEDVWITNCILHDRHFASVGIGSETSGGIRNVHIQHCQMTSRSYGVYIKSRIGRAGVIENISCDDIDILAGGFPRINLIGSGNLNIADDPVPGLVGFPTGRNFSFSNVRMAGTTLVDASQISAEKPLAGFVLKNIKGTCTRGISLADIKEVALSDIKVAGYAGAFLMQTNVVGVGLEENR